MIIQSRNSLAQEPWVPVTRSTHLEVAGTNKIRWENPNAFQASWAVQVGGIGEEQSEILLLSASTPNGTAGTFTANSLYEHPADTVIYGIKYDQVVFMRSTTGTSGTATALTGGTVNIAPDEINTIFDDTTGSSTYAYKTKFRNSVLGVESSDSDWILVGGYSPYARGFIREQAKAGLFNSSFVGTDSTWDNWINIWNQEMTNEAVAVNEAYFIGTEDVAFGTDGLGTLTTSNFKQVKRMDITYDGGVNWNLSTKANIEDFPIGQNFSQSYPRHMWKGNTVFEIRPADSGGTARNVFYTFGTTLSNDSDELAQPMRPYIKSYIDYLQAMAYQKDGKYDISGQKLSEAYAGKNQFIKEITPRDKTGPTSIRFVEPVDGDDTLYF